MGRRFDQVVDKLLRHLDRESDSELSRGMRYATSWDPYFKAYMTLADVYRYQTQHVELTVVNSRRSGLSPFWCAGGIALQPAERRLFTLVWWLSSSFCCPSLQRRAFGSLSLLSQRGMSWPGEPDERALIGARA
jgi:hypothetical protein